MSTATFERTASGKEAALVRFYQQLRRDGIPTVGALAERAGIGRAHLQRILNDKAKGTFTWRRLLRVLSAEAVCVLKQCSAWNKIAEEEWLKRERLRRLVESLNKPISTHEHEY